MNRQYLLDSLDGFKGLVFRLLPSVVVEAIACVPMITDAPWTQAEKHVFETAIGIPTARTYWTPGGFANVPKASDSRARRKRNACRHLGCLRLWRSALTGCGTGNRRGQFRAHIGVGPRFMGTGYLTKSCHSTHARLKNGAG